MNIISHVYFCNSFSCCYFSYNWESFENQLYVLCGVDSEFPGKIYYLHMNNKLYLVLGRWIRIVFPRDQILQQKSAKQKQIWLQKWLPRRLLNAMKYNVTFFKQFVRSFQNEAWSAIHVFFFSGSWKEKTFKSYNFDALGVQPTSGHLHPLLKVRAEFRKIFLEMG